MRRYHETHLKRHEMSKSIAGQRMTPLFNYCILAISAATATAATSETHINI